jgi:hypothetical protein
VCPVDEGGGLTTQLTASSVGEGPVQVTLFTGGGNAGSIGVSIGEIGATVVPIVDVAAVGTVGGLVEVPPGSAVASLVRGSASIAAEPCPIVTPPEIFLTGGATVDQRSFVVQLMNPYAGEAVVNMTVTSEVGVESSDRFSSIVVPAMSSEVLDLSDVVPGRERLSVRIEASTGRVIAVGRQEGESDGSMWTAVPGATDWLVPVPSAVGPAQLVVGNATDIDVEYQVDAYGPAGLDEGVSSGSLAPGAQSTLDLATLGEGGTQAVRVVSTGPITPLLRIEGGPILAATNGAASTSATWLLPGALTTDTESARLVVLNPGLEDVTLAITSMRAQPSEQTALLAAESVVELALGAADAYMVEASGPVVALSFVGGAGPGALSLGTPIVDG